MMGTYKVTVPNIDRDYTLPITYMDKYNAMKPYAEWLGAMGRLDSFVMTYDNGPQGITFVFNDPTTATLFRLAF